MPTYTYECLEGHQFDQTSSYQNHKNTDTCFCGLKAKQVISDAPAVIFKGSGFYSTDNRPGIDTQAED